MSTHHEDPLPTNIDTVAVMLEDAARASALLYFPDATQLAFVTKCLARAEQLRMVQEAQKST